MGLQCRDNNGVLIWLLEFVSVSHGNTAQHVYSEIQNIPLLGISSDRRKGVYKSLRRKAQKHVDSICMHRLLKIRSFTLWSFFCIFSNGWVMLLWAEENNKNCLKKKKKQLQGSCCGRLRIRLVSMTMWVQSLASLNGLKDPALLWTVELWYRLQMWLGSRIAVAVA